MNSVTTCAKDNGYIEHGKSYYDKAISALTDNITQYKRLPTFTEKIEEALIRICKEAGETIIDNKNKQIYITNHCINLPKLRYSVNDKECELDDVWIYNVYIECQDNTQEKLFATISIRWNENIQIKYWDNLYTAS